MSKCFGLKTKQERRKGKRSQYHEQGTVSEVKWSAKVSRQEETKVTTQGKYKTNGILSIEKGLILGRKWNIYLSFPEGEEISWVSILIYE